ncbi:putative immunoglobulin-like protein [Plasmopara halstedii]
MAQRDICNIGSSSDGPQTSLDKKQDERQSNRQCLSQVVIKSQIERSDRIRAVLQFKHNFDASSTRVAAQSAVFRARKDKEKEKQAQMHQFYIERGQNPYEVTRRNEVQRQAQKERSRIETNIQLRKANLLKRIEAENILQRQREKAEADNQRYERKYQREMGRAAQEERTKAYLLSRTGKESLHPTGKLVRVYPSQETELKDHSFGLGLSAMRSQHRRVIANLLAKPYHSEAKINSMLLPRQHNQLSQQINDEHGESIMTPSQELHHVNRVSTSNDTIKLPLITSHCRQGDWSEDHHTTERKPTHQSKLEKKYLEESRQRQKDSRFAHPQVVWGKLFTGNAFVANPPVLWFKDFDVKRDHCLSFTITNVSNTLNQFRLLPLNDDVNELFHIAYKRPGRMSAGMSCVLKMTFTATEYRDIETTLSIASPTGVFQIPVRCTCKKAVPVLTHHLVTFPDVVAGERTTVALTLRNDGALPFEYQVRCLEPWAIKTDNLECHSDLVTGNASGIDALDKKTEVDITPDGSMETLKHIRVDENAQDDNGDQVSSNDVKCNEPSQQPNSEAVACTQFDAIVSVREDNNCTDQLTIDEQELMTRVIDSSLCTAEDILKPIQFKKQGVVSPYSTKTLSFTFAPMSAMKIDNRSYSIDFLARSCSGAPLELSSIPIYVSGNALQTPIYVAHSRLDFRCCAYGKLYRQQLVIGNRGKVSEKIRVQLPKPLFNYVELSPENGFVQASAASQEGTLAVQVKFRPQKSMWTQIERAGWGSRKLGMLVAPVRIVVPDQIVPVTVFIIARLTTPSLRLNVLNQGTLMRGLEFGACCVGHGVSRDLLITNTARVPQRIGVTSVPKDVTVADAIQGVLITLLPEEQRILRIVYIPTSPGDLVSAETSVEIKPQLTLWSSTFNEEFKVPCSGYGVLSDLRFSHTVVRLDAISLHQVQTCNVVVTNQSDCHTMFFELLVPFEAKSFFTLSPLVARLDPHETIRVEIAFKPTEAIFTLPEKCFFAPQSQAGAASDLPVDAVSNCSDLSAMTKQSDRSKHRSCHHTWIILCIQKHDHGSDKRLSKKTVPLQALEVRTTVVDPILTSSTTVLQFGQVAVGQTVVRDLILETTQSDSVQLRAQPLQVLGAFRIIEAPRDISNSQTTSQIQVEFSPSEPIVYEDELEVLAPGEIIRVNLRGTGIKSTLSFTPSDGKVDFSDVLARTRHEKDLVLTNECAFPLEFSFVPLDEKDTGIAKLITSTGLPVFTFSPTSGCIPEHGSLSVRVVFQPDRENTGHYFQRFSIEVPNDSKQYLISLSGRCWENQLYVFAPTAATRGDDLETSPSVIPEPVEDLFGMPPDLSLSQIRNGGLSDLLTLELRKPPTTLVLIFARDKHLQSGRGSLMADAMTIDTQITNTLFIGGTMPSNGGYDGHKEGVKGTTNGSAGSFELIVDKDSPHAKLFTLEPMRGSISAGQQLKVQVTFSPPTSALTLNTAMPHFSGATSETWSELDLAEWVEVRVQCHLRGGSLWRASTTTGETMPPVAGKGQSKVNNGSSDNVDVRTVSVVLRACLETMDM